MENNKTIQNLNSAFAGESMANRKYLFFANLCAKLGEVEISKLFKETAEQETEHAFAHFRELHPELEVKDAKQLSEKEKKELVSKCLELAIEGETYEFMSMYPEFYKQAILDKNGKAQSQFQEQINESEEHANLFKQASRKFNLLISIEKQHARKYEDALNQVNNKEKLKLLEPNTDKLTQKWICRKCSMIYDPAVGDIDSGILPGTAFEDIPEDWICPICNASKKSFIPLTEYSGDYESSFQKKFI